MITGVDFSNGDWYLSGGPLASWFFLGEDDVLRDDDEVKHGDREWRSVGAARVGSTVGKLLQSWRGAGYTETFLFRRRVDAGGEEPCKQCKRNKDCGRACWWCGA